MDVYGTTYRYNPSFQTHQQRSVQTNINDKSNIVQRNQSSAYNDDSSHSCFCFESDDDSADRIRLKHTKRKIARICACNIAICAMLVVYTFVGAVVFLAIEGDSDFYSFIPGNRIKHAPSSSASSFNPSIWMTPNTTAKTWLSRISEETRARTVENIWDITVNLNILYKENWTRLAAQEVTRFQEHLAQRLYEEMSRNSQSAATKELHAQDPSRNRKTGWNLAKAFFYSLTVITTIGYGNIAPKTTLGKAVTMGYVAVGIPLMLLYLSSVGSLLSNCTRSVFTRSLCCCLCSKCGYCCYDEKRMQEKERRMRKKREQKEYEKQIQVLGHGQEPFYVRSPSSTFTTSTSNNINSPLRVENSDGVKMATTRTSSVLDSDCLSADTSIVGSRDSRSNCLAPLSFCFLIMVAYICVGALILCRLETSWTYLDGIFFCFMTLSTIGYGDSVPTSSVLSTKLNQSRTDGSLTFWFCSMYILTGMALTAMCFNVVHDEIIHRLNHNYNELPGSNRLMKEMTVSIKLGSTSIFLDSDNAFVNNSIETS